MVEHMIIEFAKMMIYSVYTHSVYTTEYHDIYMVVILLAWYDILPLS